jgi:hypothetical protein
LNVLDIKHNEKKKQIYGQYRGRKIALSETEAGERIGEYLSQYCESHGTGLELAVEDLEVNDDSRDCLWDELCR